MFQKKTCNLRSGEYMATKGETFSHNICFLHSLYMWVQVSDTVFTQRWRKLLFRRKKSLNPAETEAQGSKDRPDKTDQTLPHHNDHPIIFTRPFLATHLLQTMPLIRTALLNQRSTFCTSLNPFKFFTVIFYCLNFGLCIESIFSLQTSQPIVTPARTLWLVI